MIGPLAQSRAASLVEASANVIAGFVVAIAVQRIVYPLVGITTDLATDGLIAIIFTVASLARSYCLRRLFVAIEQHRLQRQVARLASLERRLATGRAR